MPAAIWMGDPSWSGTLHYVSDVVGGAGGRCWAGNGAHRGALLDCTLRLDTSLPGEGGTSLI